jgi:hypothetical protein
MARIIETDGLQAGMILKKSIYNRFGQMIMPEGTKLEDKHKRILKTWGVASISIVDNSAADSVEDNEFDENLREKAADLLKQRMRWNPRNFLEESLYQIAIRRTIEKLIRQGNDIT